MRIGYHKIGIGAGVIAILQRLALPIASFATLYASIYVYGVSLVGESSDQYLTLGLIAALLGFIFTRPQPGELPGAIASGWTAVEKLAIAWCGIIATLLLIGYTAKVSAVFSRRVLLTWFFLTPALSVAIWILLRNWLRHVFLKSGTACSVVIAGINNISRRLATSLRQHPEYGLEFKGYFEDRSAGRLGDTSQDTLLGKLRDLPEYERRNSIDTIFIAIPISHVQPTQYQLDDLKDKTA